MAKLCVISIILLSYISLAICYNAVFVQRSWARKTSISSAPMNGLGRWVSGSTKSVLPTGELRKMKLAMCNPAFGEQYISDETYEEWLDDIIYSGDLEGYIRRRSKELVTDDFLDFLEERLESCDDEDEKQVITEICSIVSNKLAKTDGFVDSGVVFEKRLDRILFNAPQKRRAFIESQMEDMTPGFIDYIRSELKAATDSDIKVVLASVLQMIGQAKNEDLLAGDKAMAQLVGSSSAALEGLTLNKQIQVSDRNDQILGGLMFSKNDILEDVLNNLHVIDDEFIAFLQDKIDTSKDMEERVGLTSLLETLQTVLARVKEVQGDAEIDVQDNELTVEQVKQRMQDVQMGRQDTSGGKKGTGGMGTNNGKQEFEVKVNKRDTFLEVLNRFVGLPDDAALDAAVAANYDLCDYEFMQSLAAEVATCKQEGADIEAEQYEKISAAITKQMSIRIGTAQERLQKILSKPSVKAMEAEVVAMVRKGEADEALVLLIEANVQQAEAAGALPAAKVLRTLNARIKEERERRLPDEQRLMRALLREPNSEKRKSLLYEAFRPMKSIDQDGNIAEGAPLISPPSFINAIRTVISNVGNVESMDIMNRMQTIIDEAQVVATELYGEGMSPRDQQRYMFEKQTMSVWDLARFEEEALMTGQEVPWGNDKYDNLSPEDVLAQKGKIQIGGMDGI